MAPSALADGRSTWTRDSIITALQEYVARYGEISQASLNPSTAKWGDRPDLIERYYEGRADGSPWPSLNAVKKHLGGTWSAALKAADLPARKPGPTPGSKPRAAGTAAPIRGVKVERVVIMSDRDKELSAKLAAARSRADERQAQVNRLSDKVRELSARRTIARTETKTVVKPDPALKRKLARSEAALEKTLAKVAELRNELKAAHKATQDEALLRAKAEVKASTAVQRLAQAQAAPARTEKVVERPVRDEAALTRARAAEDRAAAAESRAARHEAEVRDLRDEVEQLQTRDADATERASVHRMVAAADQRAEAAEQRAAQAERAMREQAVAITGEARRLTAEELAELRRRGPAGPVVVKAAIEKLMLARRQPGDGKLHAALTELAAACLAWRGTL